jgi:undecaprenyl diphosphate synthase
MSPHPDGYRADVERILALVLAGLELGVPIITLGLIAPGQPAHSRADQAALLQSLADLLDATAADLHALGVAVRLLGELPSGDTVTAAQLQQISVITGNNRRLILNLVFTYDSRADIAQAMRRMRADGIAPEQVTEALLSSYLVTRNIPDPDLIIQTGGRLRLGNFLLWQAAYAEYYAAPVGWLDFDRAALRAAIAAYAGRERRFGAIPTALTDCD